MPPLAIRILVRALAIFVAAVAVLFMMPGQSAEAQGGCSDEEWHNEWRNCLNELPNEPEERCKETPVASSPDSGMGGWFATPELPEDSDGIGAYTEYGYSGYFLPMYGSDCMGTVVPSGAEAGNALANMELTLATAIIGASNSARSVAWEPDRLWGWSDEFMETGSQAVYGQVFSVFGVITMALVGLYLIWRSQQADMSNAVTTAAWAVFMVILVTAVARWPVYSAQLADDVLTSSIGVVQDALGPPTAEECLDGSEMDAEELEDLRDDNPRRCIDARPPAMRAADMSTGDVLYRNWLAATLGQSEQVYYEEDANGEYERDENDERIIAGGNAAYKYGPALYDAQALTWEEVQAARSDVGERQSIIERKEQQWRNVSAAIQREFPEAYEHLTGGKAWERTGTGLLALLAAIFFALFDITASILIILGFMIIRFSVVALPIIGTIAILRPASAGFKRMMNAVLAAAINVVVFAIASAIYLFAVRMILAADMSVWLQVLLIALLGAAAWMLLRPYRRLASLAGGQSVRASLWAGGRGKRGKTESGGSGGSSGGGSSGGVLGSRRLRPHRVRPESRPDTVTAKSPGAPKIKPQPAASPRDRVIREPGRGSGMGASASDSRHNLYRPSNAQRQFSSGGGGRVGSRPD